MSDFVLFLEGDQHLLLSLIFYSSLHLLNEEIRGLTSCTNQENEAKFIKILIVEGEEMVDDVGGW